MIVNPPRLRINSPPPSVGYQLTSQAVYLVEASLPYRDRALELANSLLINSSTPFLIDVGVSSCKINVQREGQSSRVPLTVTSLIVHVNSSIVTWTDKLAFRIFR